MPLFLICVFRVPFFVDSSLGQAVVEQRVRIGALTPWSILTLTACPEVNSLFTCASSNVNSLSHGRHNAMPCAKEEIPIVHRLGLGTRCTSLTTLVYVR